MTAWKRQFQLEGTTVSVQKVSSGDVLIHSSVATLLSEVFVVEPLDVGKDRRLYLKCQDVALKIELWDDANVLISSKLTLH